MHTQCARNFNWKHMSGPAPRWVLVDKVSHKRNSMRYGGFGSSSVRASPPPNLHLGKSFEFSQNDKMRSGASRCFFPGPPQPRNFFRLEAHAMTVPLPMAPDHRETSREPYSLCPWVTSPIVPGMLSSSRLHHLDWKLQGKEPEVCLPQNPESQRSHNKTQCWVKQNGMEISRLCS